MRLCSISGRTYSNPPISQSFRHSNRELPTVLLVSGACSDLTWLYGGDDSIAAQLHRQGRDVVVKPLLGFSSTPKDLRNFQWRLIMEDLRNELLPLLESGRQVQLVGYSLGTFGVIQLAREQAFRNACLKGQDPFYPMVLFNPPFVLNDWAAKWIDLIYQHTGCFDTSSTMPAHDSLLLRALLSVRYGLGDAYIAREYLRRILPYSELRLELEIDGPLIYRTWPTIALARYLLQIPTTRRNLLEIDSPVRIISSQLDQLAMPVGSLDSLLNEKALAHSTLVNIPNGGHFWLMLDPASRETATKCITDPA